MHLPMMFPEIQNFLDYNKSSRNARVQLSLICPKDKRGWVSVLRPTCAVSILVEVQLQHESGLWASEV